MHELQQRLNKTAFLNALKNRNISQGVLAEKLGVNEKSFSRWINDGFVQTQYLWDLTEELDLNDDELDEILLLPKYKVFFRRKYLGEVSEKIEEKAIELAKTLLGLAYLNSNARFCPPNASKVETEVEVANQIRKYTGINTFNNLQGIVSSLAEQGVEVTVVPFGKLGLASDEDREQAFSVTDEKRCLIFLDAASPEELLIFNLCHELCHLFRPDLEHSKVEEKFCNDVASELVYPKAFFETHKETIDGIIQAGSLDSIVNLLNVIKDTLGGELFGISLRLKSLGIFSQKNPKHQSIINYSRISFSKLPKIGDRFFQSFDAQNRDEFLKFWNSPKLDNNSLLRFFFHIKNAAISGSISARKFSELFEIDLGLADEMFHRWKNDLQGKLEANE
jgi:Zn-dependent peptidase ImmA (M78 family)